MTAELVVVIAVVAAAAVFLVRSLWNAARPEKDCAACPKSLTPPPGPAMLSPHGQENPTDHRRP